MNAQNAVVAVVALAAGATLGYVLKPAAEPSALAPTTAVHETRKPITTEADAELKALRQQVKALRAQLAAQSEVAATAARVEEDADRRRGPGFGGEDMKLRFEQWKKDHPEEFARMEQHQREQQRRRAEQSKSRQEFLASIDTSKMTAEEKETHAKLQGLLAKRDQLEARMAQAMELPDDERGQLFEEMRETSHAIRELNGKEREALFRQMSAELGVEGEDSKVISSTISEILEATDGGFGGRGPGGRGPGGRGPGGPRGGRGGR